jgi:protein-S-isoprenylcysteine O-methyltransferase Ste14
MWGRLRQLDDWASRHVPPLRQRRLPPHKQVSALVVISLAFTSALTTAIDIASQALVVALGCVAALFIAWAFVAIFRQALNPDHDARP